MLAVSTDTLLSGERHTHRGPQGSLGVTRQMGEQQEVTLWTGREKVPCQEEGL